MYVKEQSKHISLLILSRTCASDITSVVLSVGSTLHSPRSEINFLVLDKLLSKLRILYVCTKSAFTFIHLTDYRCVSIRSLGSYVMNQYNDDAISNNTITSLCCKTSPVAFEKLAGQISF